MNASPALPWGYTGEKKIPEVYPAGRGINQSHGGEEPSGVMGTGLHRCCDPSSSPWLMSPLVTHHWVGVRSQHSAISTGDADLAEWKRGQGFWNSGALTGLEETLQAVAGA